MRQKLVVLAALLPLSGFANTLHSSTDPSGPVYNPSQQHLQQQMQINQQQQQLKLQQDQQRQQQDLQRKIRQHRNSAQRFPSDAASADNTLKQSQE